MDPRDTIVRLKVGATSEIFSVHCGLLCKTSEFFKRAVKPEWAEQRDDPKSIDLSDDSTEAVEIYVQWLYTEKIHVDISRVADEDHAKRCAASQTAYTLLALSYIFGDRIMDTAFKNALLKKFLETGQVYGWAPGPTAATFIYEGTTAGSPLRHLVADMVAYMLSDHHSWATYLQDYPRDLLVDALVSMSKVRVPGTISKIKSYIE